MERFKDNKRKAFYGKCLVVLQADKAGKTVLKATSPGLESAEVIFKTR
jgi:beta-galactosidase